MRIDISFDDGHVSDLRAAKILKKYGFKGTFYLPSTKADGTIPMTIYEVKTGIVDLGHELGGHTVSHHQDLKQLPDRVLQFQILNNRVMLEGIFKKPCVRFCYPRGRHDERVRKVVQASGFLEARTTLVLKIRNEFNDPFRMPTTIQMFPRKEYNGVSWPVLAREWFLKALEASRNDDRVFFSIWAHSVDLDRQRDWQEFEDFLKFMRENAGLVSQG